MTKLVELIKKCSVVEAPRMGFGVPAKKTESLPLIIMVKLPSADKAVATSLIADGAHALLVEIPKLAGNESAVRELVDLNASVPVGVLINEPQVADVERLGDSGADFVVLRPETTPSAFLRPEDVTRLLMVDSGQNDLTLRAVGRLPVDGVLASVADPGKGMVTIQETLEMQKVLELVRKPSFVIAPEGLLADDLETLRDLGFLGVVLDVSKPGTQEAISLYRQKLKNMPVRRRANRESITPFLPQLRETPQPRETPMREDEVPDEDDEFQLA